MRSAEMKKNYLKVNVYAYPRYLDIYKIRRSKNGEKWKSSQFDFITVENGVCGFSNDTYRSWFLGIQ